MPRERTLATGRPLSHNDFLLIVPKRLLLLDGCMVTVSVATPLFTKAVRKPRRHRVTELNRFQRHQESQHRRGQGVIKQYKCNLPWKASSEELTVSKLKKLSPFTRVPSGVILPHRELFARLGVSSWRLILENMLRNANLSVRILVDFSGRAMH